MNILLFSNYIKLIKKSQAAQNKFDTQKYSYLEHSTNAIYLEIILLLKSGSQRGSLTFSLACRCPSPIFLKLPKYSFSKFCIFWVCEFSHSALSLSAKRVNCWFLLCFMPSLICKAMSLSCSWTWRMNISCIMKEA